jgi:hypothetical protein
VPRIKKDIQEAQVAEKGKMLPRASSLHNNGGELDYFSGPREQRFPASELFCLIIAASCQSLFRLTVRRANRNQSEAAGENEDLPHQVC